MTDATTTDPTSIGPFVILRKLGEGAMGLVYAGYDIMLDRKVAIKLVRRQFLHNTAIRARMLREAQAMARLSSPYVVPVYQAGEHDFSIYIAMEYIEGQTLAAWLRAEPRPWQTILRTVCDAGRGLAAAHAAGFVHRDFKPDNVLIDRDGKARVLDFGLVRSEGGDEPIGDRRPTPVPLPDRRYTPAPLPDSRPTPVPLAASSESTLPIAVEAAERSPPHWSVRLTQIGNSLGTPAYMSPEQHFGRPTGPASDQFSFAIALYESLYGVRPFPGRTWDKIREQIKAGVVPPPPTESRAPRRLYKVLARALTTDPDARWPSLDAMIAALEHDPWRGPLRAGALAGALASVSVVSFAAAVASGPDDPGCGTAGDEIAGVWNPERERAVERAFVATRAPFAADVVRQVGGRLDAYAQAWSDARRSTCEAAGVEIARMTELRVACLARRKAHLATLIEVFGTTTDRAVVEHAVQAVAALPSLQACDDVDALLGAAPPPDAPQTARRVESLREQLTGAAVLEDTGMYEDGLALVARIRREAEPLGYKPLLAEVELAEGRLRIAAADARAADRALTRAIELGVAHDLHAITAEAVVRRIFAVGVGQGRHAEALAVETFAEALVRRAGDDGRLAALLHNNLGAVYDMRGEIDAARAHYERTIAVLEHRSDQPDPLLPIIYHNIGNMEFDRGDPDAALPQFAAAHELFTRIHGDAHPYVAHALAGLGDAQAHAGADADALASYLAALARMEATYGAVHLYLLHPLDGLGRVYARLGLTEQATLHLARAVDIADELDIHHVHVARSLALLAELSASAGDLARARDLQARADAMSRELAGDDRESLDG